MGHEPQPSRGHRTEGQLEGQRAHGIVEGQVFVGRQADFIHVQHWLVKQPGKPDCSRTMNLKEAGRDKRRKEGVKESVKRRNRGGEVLKQP